MRGPIIYSGVIVPSDVYEQRHFRQQYMHDSFAYQVGGCQVVANPAGYALNRLVTTKGDVFELESRHFNPSLMLDGANEH